ncbi:MAG: 2-oxo-tetronate isomerase [Hyphomicrobium sp.]
MPKFAANLSMLFTERPFPDRFQAAAAAGFKGIEFLFPYEFEVHALAQHWAASGLTQVLFNMPPGDWAKGERGIACLPGRRGEFQAGVTAALSYARALSCNQIHCMAGIVPAGLDPAAARATYIENLRYAAAMLAADGIKLLIEPINTFDMPGFFLNRTAQALDIISEAGMPNIRLQYDCYHMHLMEGHLAATIERHLPSIAHVQIAGAPGRHEPNTGEIDYPPLFQLLDRLGYDGWVGCEYRPKSGTLEGLGWMENALSKVRAS